MLISTVTRDTNKVSKVQKQFQTFPILEILIELSSLQLFTTSDGGGQNKRGRGRRDICRRQTDRDRLSLGVDGSPARCRKIAES